jgi:general secretion pathway protein J
MKRGVIAKPYELGFTLLELLISIVLLATMTVIVTGAMRLGHRAVAGGEKKIVHLERLRMTLTIMNSQLLSAIPLTLDENGTRRFYFEGRPNYLKLSTNYSIWGGQKGNVIVEYWTRADDTTQSLWASEYTMGMDRRRETKMLEGIKTVRFEYFQKDPNREDGAWVPEWTDATKTPEKIRITIALGKKEILLLVPLRVQGTLDQTMQGIRPGSALPRLGLSFDAARKT